MKKRRTLIVGLGLALVALVAGLVWIVVATPAAPTVPVPDPNGYALFLEAGGQRVDPNFDFLAASADALRTHLADNAQQLARVHEGLQMESVVPIEFTAPYRQQLMHETNATRAAGRLLWTEARLANLEVRPDEAAGLYVDLLEFGEKIARGGVFLQIMVGIAQQRSAIEELLELVPTLSSEQKAELLERVEGVPLIDYDNDDVEKREYALAVAEMGKIMTMVTYRTMGGYQAVEEKTNKANENVAQLHEQLLHELRDKH